MCARVCVCNKAGFASAIEKKIIFYNVLFLTKKLNGQKGHHYKCKNGLVENLNTT